MARSTCDPNADVPNGMMKFEVIRSTIKDSIGQYCVPGDMAILKPSHAKSYLAMNYIRVQLPEGFGDDSEEIDEAQEALHAEGHRTPPAKGRGAARREEVAAQREREIAKQEAADAERDRIIQEAKDEAARIVAEAKASDGPDPEPSEADSADEPEESPTGGEAEPSADAAGEGEEERSEAEADTSRPATKRRRRSAPKS